VKEILYFHFDSCPYCRQANKWMDELMEENAAYQRLRITRVDERKNPSLADQYDYYYVPTYYVGGAKLHEGAATKAAIARVFEAALSDASASELG